jgi:hypothetical protein
MQAIQQLSRFIALVTDDPRIGPVHISLYGALLSLWEQNAFENPISVFSHEVMPRCKISGLATYHRSIRELHQYGYIKYVPSYNHFLGSLVYVTGTEKQEMKVKTG